MRGVYMYVKGSLVCIRAVARRERTNGLGPACRTGTVAPSCTYH